MRIEDAIRQKQFRNEHHKAAINLIYTYGWVVARFKALLDNYDITAQQYNLLRILRGQHPAPASVLLLRERLLDKMSDVPRLLKRLEAKKLIRCTDCRQDRRRTDVLITARGLQLLSKIDRIAHRFDKVMSRLNAKEARQLNVLLDKVRAWEE